MKPLVVIDAPSNLGLRPPRPGHEPGCRLAPSALRARGLLERLGAADGGCVEPPPYDSYWDGQTTRNAEAIAAYSRALATTTGATAASGAFPLVLGGDCSILLSDLLALARQGTAGLLFLDGHLDFRHPGNAPATGAAAGEDLALATGRGIERLTTLNGDRPLVADSHVVAIGNREYDDLGGIEDTAITVYHLRDARRLGPEGTASAALDHLGRQGLDRFWVHLDIDVIDSRLMPAVDSPQPDGLTWDEVGALLRPLVAHPLAAGMEVTIYDPELDPEGTGADHIVDLLAGVFA